MRFREKWIFDHCFSNLSILEVRAGKKDSIFEVLGAELGMASYGAACSSDCGTSGNKKNLQVGLLSFFLKQIIGKFLVFPQCKTGFLELFLSTIGDALNLFLDRTCLSIFFSNNAGDLHVISLKRKIVQGDIKRPLQVPTPYKASTPITKPKQKYDLDPRKHLLLR
jgi:hypothetical protein